MKSLVNEGASVYRYYDLNGLLLYVGYTARGSQRNTQHATDKDWWPFVHHQEVEHFETVDQAKAREKHLIRRFRPPFNKQHNPDWESIRSAYLALAINPASNGLRPLLEILKGNAKQLPCRIVLQNEEELIVASDPTFQELALLCQTNHENAPVYVHGQKLGRLGYVRQSATSLIAIAKLRHPIPTVESAFFKLSLKKDGGTLRPHIKSLQVAYKIDEEALIDAFSVVINRFQHLLDGHQVNLERAFNRAVERHQMIQAAREAADRDES